MTSWVVSAVAPRSSVTVRVIVYVPASVYVCVAVRPVPVAPSPKDHAYASIVPSVSADADASTATARSVTSVVNDAVGTAFGSSPVAPSAWCSATVSASSCRP